MKDSAERSTGQGRAKLVSFAISFLSLAAVGAVAYWELGNRRSPGPLHPSHAAVSVLQGGSGCVECHGSVSEEMDGACLKCHTSIQSQVDNGAGIHGLDGAAAEHKCRECHVDHAGRDVALVSTLSWSLAGISRDE